MDAAMIIGGVKIETRSYGNLFMADGVVFDGMAVFVMCGLTGFRPQSYDFINDHCKRTSKAKGRVWLYEMEGGIPIAYDRNHDNHIYANLELYELLNDAISLLIEAGAKRILMNGIRSRVAPNPLLTDENELDTLRALIQWIQFHPNSGLEKVICMSGGGEFARALGHLEPSKRVDNGSTDEGIKNA